MGRINSILLLLMAASGMLRAQPAELPEGAFPFDYSGGHIYVDMYLNDTVPGKWLFDTGAVNLYPDSTEFAAYPFLARTKRRFRGVGQNIVSLDVVLDTLTLGNGALRLSSTRAALMDIKKFLGYKPSGVVGTDMVRDTVLEINFSGSFMRLADRSLLPPKGYSEIPLEIHNTGILLIPMKVTLQNGEEFEGRFVYDTGSSGMLSINSPAVARWELDQKIGNRIEQYFSERGVGGESRHLLFQALSVEMGGYGVRMPLVDYSLNTEGVSSSDEFEGIVGNYILCQFDHILDIRGRKLYIKPATHFGNLPREQVCGFHYVDRRDIQSGFIVTSLDVRGPAEKGGLIIGDNITHINGIAIEERTLKYFNNTIQRPYLEYTLTVWRDAHPYKVRIRNRGIFLTSEPLRDYYGIIRN